MSSKIHIKTGLHWLLCGLLTTFASAYVRAQEVVDVLVLYAPETLNTRAGRDIEARSAAYIEYANQAYANSDVNTRLRLVGVKRLDAGYNSVDSDTLGQLRSNATAAEWRRQTGADLVTLLTLPTAQGSGYICGIGYMPPGDASSEQFYRNASSAGFSLVGVECGLSTFAHELGHNMGLGHSYRQNSDGSVFPWGRGHGVDGLFSTIMAYPQSYGTRNQLPLFSNPRSNNCAGTGCGIDRNRDNGADASESLNRLISQVSNFSPTIVPRDDEEDEEDTNTDTNEPTPENCQKPEVAGNLITNGEFSNLSGWASAFNASTLSQDAIVNSCRDTLLVVGERSRYYSAAYTDLTGKLNNSTTYLLSARLGIRGTEQREDIRIAFRRTLDGQTSYQYADPVSVTSAGLTDYTTTISFASGSVNGLIIYGPSEGVDILVDSIRLIAQSSDDPEPPETSAEPDPQIVDAQFERTAKGWASFYSTRLSYSAMASKGDYSLLSAYRRSVYSGPVMDITGLLESNTSYRLSADVRIDNNLTDSQNTHIWIYYEDSAGGHWQNIVRDSLAPGKWYQLGDAFIINASGSIRSARLHFFGPPAGTLLRIDDVTIQ